MKISSELLRRPYILIYKLYNQRKDVGGNVKHDLLVNDLIILNLRITREIRGLCGRKSEGKREKKLDKSYWFW